MAVSFVVRKCACGGKLEYEPAKKIWICMYCGTVVEREATFDKIHVDGIEGINDVARQTLMDIANQKMDSASKNLEDCERKGHKHIGTLLANLSYNFAAILRAKTQDEKRPSLEKMKMYRDRLQREFPVIAEEEINLYEAFGEDAADIFANLFVVFHFIDDFGRVEYISSKFHPEKVFSQYANMILLNTSIKRKEFDVVDKIINNIGHIDRKSSLQEILEHYPGSEKKSRLIKALFDSKTAVALSKKYFENYFLTSSDPIDIKAVLIKQLNITDIHVNAEIIVKSAEWQFEGYSDAKCLFDAIYEVRISDQETEALLVFCLMINKKFEVQNAFFDTLIKKNVFVALSARAVISFLDSSKFDGETKAEILNKMLKFHLDAKALDTIYNYYLNNNTDDMETRKQIINVLLVAGAPITARTVKNYVLKTQTDGNDKLDVIKKIFATGIDKTYVGDLLSDYMLHSDDTEEMEGRVSEFLIGQGFKAGSDVLSQYVLSSQDDIKIRIGKAKRLIRNGTQIKADTLDTYIMLLKRPDEFSEDMFNLLSSYNYTVGVPAYIKFLLFCKDIDKVRHNEKLVHALNGDINSHNATVNHNGDSITCNAFQAYVLNTADDYDVAAAIVSQFHALRVKLNTDILSNGMSVKFKKYVGKNKSALSPLSLRLCEENKMFSLF